MNKSVLSSKGGLPPTLFIEGQPVGYLLFRQDTDEFFHSHKSGRGFCGYAYTKEAAFAYRFDTEKMAFQFSRFIDREFEIVPLYDTGDQLVVAFSSEEPACVPCQG